MNKQVFCYVVVVPKLVRKVFLTKKALAEVFMQNSF